MRATLYPIGITLVFAAVISCSDDATIVDEASGDAGDDAGAVQQPLCTAATVPCQDESIQQLDLFADPSPDLIADESVETDRFRSFIDSSGGGRPTTQSFVYARFTDQGLEKVDIGDEAAFTSTDWDIAFRRFVVRINSGVSGPSCVQAARTAPGTAFEDLDTVPSDLDFRTESYFTETCTFVADSGIGSPATAMISYWQYQACVEMTGNVFVLALADGRFVKLEVLAYYEPDNQQTCNETRSVPLPSGAGNIRIQWAFID